MHKTAFILSCLILGACTVYKVPEEEFRGVWIATVVNIDWPNNALDGAAVQKEDFLKILDFYQTLNFNAVIVQIRTTGDALYPTNFAPWSKYLTGKEGKAPKDFPNPLRWMVRETHKRGMEFHAWLNPYRATFDLDTMALSIQHDFYEHPDWMVRYGKKYYYNPGLPEVQDKFSKVVEEIVAAYEVDAIHLDDYFYPYKIEGETFNDSTTFRTHGLKNQKLEDWRRSNIDSLVKKVHLSVKKTKPWVQFGISPFGVWKNNDTDPIGSPTRAGQTTYEDLYADPLFWLEKGWLDYIAPQAYWSMDHPPAPHRKITQWWADTVQMANLYMGNGPYKIKNNPDRAWNRKNEIPDQIQFARKTGTVKGNIFFSAKSLMGKHENVTRALRKMYRYPSKNPPLPKKTERALGHLKTTKQQRQHENLRLCLSHNDSVPRFVLYYALRENHRPDTKILIGKSYLSAHRTTVCDKVSIPRKYRKSLLAISIIDTYGNESELQMLNPN